LSDDDLDAELAALRIAYGRELPAKARAIGASTRRAITDDAAHAEAIALSHRLRGTAGAYGFAEISRAAADIEDALLGGSRDAATLERLATAIDAAADALSKQPVE
jgi:HPt (histidine-containing phosphotransfer) domain-containing protein